MANSKALTKQDILGADDRKSETVDVPEWGGTVTVRVMSGSERDRYEVAMVNRAEGKAEANLTDMRARLVAMTIVDESGALMFGENEVQALGAKSALALDRVFAVAQRLNGFGKELPQAMASAEKNSEAAPSGAFG